MNKTFRKQEDIFQTFTLDNTHNLTQTWPNTEKPMKTWNEISAAMFKKYK